MTTSSRREVLIATASLSVSALAFAAEPRRVSLDFGRDRLTEMIPPRVGMRTGTPDSFVVPESVDAAPSNDDSLSRSYTDAASPPIMLLVSYHAARSRELKVHRPETCYGVAGFDVTARHPVELPWRRGSSVPCVAFQGRRGDRMEVVLYWTRVADSFPQTLSAQRAAFLRQAIAGVRADGLLVRLSTIDTDEVGASARLARFGADLIGSVHGAGRKLLLGSAYGT